MNLPLKIMFFRKGIHQIKAAQDLGMDPAKLSKLVNGWIEPKPEERKALANYLGEPEESLFDMPSRGE